MKAKRLAFWVGVGGAAILANFTVELAARKLPWPGLQRFVAFIHCGPGGSNG